MPLLFALAILAWWRATRKPWSRLGLDRPRLLPILHGFLFGIALKLVLKAVVMPLLGASPINRTYHSLEGNTAALPAMILVILVVAGFGEEVTFRGFVFDRLGAWWGRSRWATVATVIVSAGIFGLAHLSGQDWDAVKQATIVGLVVGAIYARTRSLWPLMSIHMAFDLTALALIYFGWETRIAHLLFEP